MSFDLAFKDLFLKKRIKYITDPLTVLAPSLACGVSSFAALGTMKLLSGAKWMSALVDLF